MARPPHNSQTILREHVEAERLEQAPEESFSDYFEFFVPSILLRERNLAADELSDGVVGEGGDGGVDALYVFVDDVLVSEDTDLSVAKNGALVQLHIMQAKTSPNFTEAALNSLIGTSRDLFALGVDEEEFGDVYNADVRAAFARFRATYRSLLRARKAPRLQIIYTYAAIRAPDPLSRGVQRRIEALREAAEERFPDAVSEVHLLGASEIWQRVIARPQEVRSLETQRAATGRNGYVCLVALPDLNDFLRNADREAALSIFDDNVRDWQGLTPVNQKIAEELAEGGDRDFWWLNNGVTVLCSNYQNDDGLISVRDPSIVNGLQTCREIVRAFDRDNVAEDDERVVLVKVIRVDDEQLRDRIIRATNNQNPVSIAMLRATDPFQRSIEQYLFARELYYERRKNFYKNRGRPKSKIISIGFLAQAVLTLFEFRPDDARARPSNPLSGDEEYSRLFSPETPLNAYFKAAYICRYVELYLKNETGLNAKDTNNLRFYVAVVLCWQALGRADVNQMSLADIDVEDIDGEAVEAAFDFCQRTYVRVDDPDQAARGTDLKRLLRQKMIRHLRAN